MKNILFTLVLLASFNSFGQLSSYNITTYAGGKSVNVKKYVERFIAVFDTYILVRSDDNFTYYKKFKRYATENKNRCVHYWTTDVETKKTVLFKLCEDEVTPYMEKVNYTNKKRSKVIRYYYDD
jgi:uncharacterized protein YegJ (DUF2314 family)